MLVRTIMILTTLLAIGVDAASAKSHHARRHYVRTVVEPVPPTYAGTYVLHPAHNIACDTRYRSTRALPCDQPVWVYGNVCEIDLGLGFYRPCE
jgi:hypothetical protein